jgi:hypothetical protein
VSRDATARSVGRRRRREGRRVLQVAAGARKMGTWGGACWVSGVRLR